MIDEHDEWQPASLDGWQRHLYRKPGARRRISEYHGPKGQVLSSREFLAFEQGVSSGTPAPVVMDLPEPAPDKPAKETVKAGLATPEEIAKTAQIALMIGTILAAIFTKLPELQMSEDEARGFAVPLGNILEKTPLNRQYGAYVRDGGDYLLLGYATYSYLYRVSSSLQARAQQQEGNRGQRGSAPGQHSGDHGLGAAQNAGQPPTGTPTTGYQSSGPGTTQPGQSNGRPLAQGGLAQFVEG